MYIRGHAGDYDQWGQMGLKGWSYADVLPYFKRAETYEHGANDFHGGSGPLNVSESPLTSPIYKAFIEAGREAGYPVTNDFNGAQQEGSGSAKLGGDRGSVQVADYPAPEARLPAVRDEWTPKRPLPLRIYNPYRLTPLSDG